MKQIKRYACILITVLLLASTPSAALAAAEYVPTKAVCTPYTKKGNEWVQDGSAITYTWSYKKDGRPIKTASLAESGKGSWVRRSWKGDLVKKIFHCKPPTGSRTVRNGERYGKCPTGMPDPFRLSESAFANSLLFDYVPS